MSYDFHYIRSSTGELSGLSLATQTELALSEIGTQSETGVEAYALAESATTLANNAQSAADAAQSTADEALATAKSAQSTSDSATTSTAEALAAAQAAQESADAAQESADSKADIYHASEETTYGVGNGTLYGHVMLSDETASDYGVDSGTAATPYAVEQAMNAAATAQETAETAQATAETAQEAAESVQESAEIAQSTADSALSVVQSIRTAEAYTETTSTETDTELIISPVDDTDGVYWMTTAEYTTDDDGVFYDTDGNEINEYSAEGTYAYGDLVYLDGVVYECVQANGVGVYETTEETSTVAIDADEMTDTGFYYVDAALGNDNLPTENGGYLEIFDDTEGAYIVQTFTDSDGVVYSRTAVISEGDDGEDVYSWSDWQGGEGDYVPLSGDAGEVSYYETAVDVTTVDESSASAIETADAVSISDGTAGTAWTKVIHLTGDSPTVTAGSAWNWTGGEAPTLETGAFIVACWCGSAGLLTYHLIS